MKILLLGSQGQLGRELQDTLSAAGHLKSCGRNEIDLTNKTDIINIIRSFEPEYIVNAAAYTAVDKAESEIELAFAINADAVSIIANEAKNINAKFIHYSTDYVFDGWKTEPYVESDKSNPLNVYGKSKLKGEEAIIGSECEYMIFRTTWVIGQYGNNFAKTILKLAKERDSLSIINDQYGAPSSTELIAKVTKAVIEKDHFSSGIYHLAPSGRTTWYDMAKLLLQLAQKKGLTLKVNENSLHPIRTSEYPTPAARPKNSLLNCNKLEQETFKLENWEHGFLKVSTTIIEDILKHET